MPETHVISALLEKRSPILGEIEANRFQAMWLRSELGAVDSVIRMFKPDQVLPTTAKVTTAKSPAALPRVPGRAAR